MEYKGVVKGNIIEFENPLPFENGARVEVFLTLEKKPRKGSPQAILQLTNTLTSEEAETILRASRECRSIDQELWK
ncbi:hypothetical protein FJZ33_05300 [Candidatus Poribacteria bacterium]|nr:hypothetical protein [Candidatus Poribacteria bacterium]